MSTLSVTKPYNQRRRHSPEFKSRIVSACAQPGISVSRIALDNSLNTNMVRRWIRESERAGSANIPAVTPLSSPAVSAKQKPEVKSRVIRVEIPRSGDPVVVEWPADQAHQCVALLRDLLRDLLR